MKNKILIILVLFLALVSCNKQETVGDLTIHSSDNTSYPVAIPFEPSQLRYFHYADNALDIGQNMIEYSKNYFSTSKYILHEGSILKEHGDDLLALINRSSDSNPTGLNPSVTTVFDIGNNKTVTGPVIINDIFEINFREINQPNKLAAITLALVVRSNIEDDKGNIVTVDSEKLYAFATNAGIALASYFQSLPGVFDAPIGIIIYDDSKIDDGLSGTVIAEGLFTGRSGQFTRINQSTAFLPTNTSSEKDKALYNQFLNLKKSLLNYIPENLSIIGKGLYEENQAIKLKITVTILAKTYTEVYVLTEYLISLLNDFPEELLIIVEIKNFNNTLVVLRKESNSTQINKIVLD